MSFRNIEKNNLPTLTENKVSAGKNLFNGIKERLINFDIDKLMGFVQCVATGDFYADKISKFAQKLKNPNMAFNPALTNKGKEL